MKIRSVEVVECPPRWLLLRVETGDGEVGWGEAIGDLHEETTAALIAAGKRIEGREIDGIERLKTELHRGRFWRDGPVLNTALSAVEIALWDLQGKQLGAPIHQLLGGPVRDKVRVYRNLWGDSPAQFAASARAAVEEGLTMVKVSPCEATPVVASDADLAPAIETVSAVRDAIGDFNLAIDIHGRLSPTASRRFLGLLEPYDPCFVEEPCLPDGSSHHLRDLQQLHLEQRIPLATGERLLTKRQFADHLFPSPVVGVMQPDVSLVGGIRATAEIGAMCETAQVALAPHCPYGPIQFAASLQVAALCSSHAFQEFQSLGGAGGGGKAGGGAEWAFDLLAEPFTISDGMVSIPTKSGLGIEIQEDLIDEHRELWNPHPPTLWQHPDGSHAEW